MNEEYWGAPVPGFGDPDARLLLVGLAPGAHGSNRTGRMFTGDASGAFLYPALYRCGIANQPNSTGRNDGLELRGTWITAAARCVPPGNKPTTKELNSCQTWLDFDMRMLSNVRAVLAIGKVGHDAVIKVWRERGLVTTLAAHPFSHGVVHRFDGLPGAEQSGAVPIIDTYHVSFQNTNTGRLTPEMFDNVLLAAKLEAGLN